MEKILNLCDPLIFNTACALNFCKRHVCLSCHGTLQSVFQGADTFTIRCLNCKQPIREGDYIRLELVEINTKNQAIAEIELKDKPKTTIEQAIKDLGF